MFGKKKTETEKRRVKLLKAAKKYTRQGWTVVSINADEGIATLERQTTSAMRKTRRAVTGAWIRAAHADRKQTMLLTVEGKKVRKSMSNRGVLDNS